MFNTIDFPDVDGATQPPSCRIDGDPKCESTRSNVAAGKLPFWQLPDSFAFTPTSLSEAQLVQVGKLFHMFLDLISLQSAGSQPLKGDEKELSRGAGAAEGARSRT